MPSIMPAPGETRAYDSGKRYRDVWGQPDLSKTTEEERALRNKDAAEINDAYYDFITDHYESGWGEKFHFSGYQPDESWAEGAARHEHHLAYMTGIKAGDKVLDIGCGVGGPAREIAIFTGADITAITINQLQVERGTLYNAQAKLSDQIHMVRANMIDLPFKNNEFDKIYSIEALCCAPDVDKACVEAFRVLKPGGTFGLIDWLITPEYDDSNEKHRMIRSVIERGSAVPHLRTAKDRIANLKKAGFEVLFEEDRALSKANPVPWWYALDHKHAVTVWDRWMSWNMRPYVFNVVYGIVKVCHWMGLTHPSRMEALDTVSQCVYACRDGGKEGIFTPMHLFICRKPEK